MNRSSPKKGRLRTTVSDMLQLDPNKLAVDLGISIQNWEATKAFYCDVLGMEHVADMPVPTVIGSGGLMHRVQSGETTLKFVEMNNPSRTLVPGGPGRAMGLRYMTIWVRNLRDVVEECRAANFRIALEPVQVRPGVMITMIEDPDGNWVELLQNDPD